MPQAAVAAKSSKPASGKAGRTKIFVAAASPPPRKIIFFGTEEHRCFA